MTKKRGYDKLDKTACMDYAEGYKAFLDEGKTERDAVEAIVRMAEAKGYKAFVRGMEVKPGDKFYQVNRYKGRHPGPHWPGLPGRRRAPDRRPSGCAPHRYPHRAAL